ncbi:MAG: RlmE family RNA methyltransferase [Myxococcota bacterium]|nr:RlmE family RNA methyltransferase [Myxococcota bacterium]
MRSGQRVVDLGAWPGGWLQVAAEQVGPSGRVVGIDIADIEPFGDDANVIAIQGDLLEPGVDARILAALGGLADVALSDAAPKLTGVRATDRAREETLLEAVEALLPKLLRPGGALILKLLESPEAQAAAKRIGRCFGSAKIVGLRATRAGSSEKYLIGKNYAAGA